MVCCIEDTEVTGGTSSGNRIIWPHPSLCITENMSHQLQLLSFFYLRIITIVVLSMHERTLYITRSIASIAEPILVVAKGTQNGFIFL
jgi:hypothetical protein